MTHTFSLTKHTHTKAMCAQTQIGKKHTNNIRIDTDTKTHVFFHKVNVNIFPDKPEQIITETYQSNIYVTNTNIF